MQYKLNDKESFISVYADFSEKLTFLIVLWTLNRQAKIFLRIAFLTPDTNTDKCVSGGKKC